LIQFPHSYRTQSHPSMTDTEAAAPRHQPAQLNISKQLQVVKTPGPPNDCLRAIHCETSRGRLVSLLSNESQGAMLDRYQMPLLSRCAFSLMSFVSESLQVGSRPRWELQKFSEDVCLSSPLLSLIPYFRREC
jgi:hypothetical protein